MRNFITLWKILRKLKVHTLRFPELTPPSTFFRVLSISWSYRCKKHTTSTFSPLIKIFVRLMMVSIILPSKQKDIPVFKYNLRMVPMWVICNSNILEQLKTICWFNCNTLTPKEFKSRVSLYVFEMRALN